MQFIRKSLAWANRDASPGITRRGLLAGTAAAAASPVTAIAAPAGAAPADPAVTMLAQKFAAALATYAAAERHRNACERRYLDDGPMPPAALTRAGPLGKSLHDWQWWNADDLRDLLADRARRKHW